MMNFVEEKENNGVFCQDHRRMVHFPFSFLLSFIHRSFIIHSLSNKSLSLPSTYILMLSMFLFGDVFIFAVKISIFVYTLYLCYVV